MPRKIRVQADLAQNRLSQRQCRARKKEYVAALEARLRQYEESEVQASLDMQQAARAVAWKNKRLLMLLAQHGVSQLEIDAFLQLPDAGGHVHPASSDSRSDQGTSNHESPPKIRDGRTITVCNGKLEGHSSYTPTDDTMDLHSTSCDTAATIIAGLQGHGDPTQAREILGCEGEKNCHVKNTRLFQLIDETA